MCTRNVKSTETYGKIDQTQGVTAASIENHGYVQNYVGKKVKKNGIFCQPFCEHVMHPITNLGQLQQAKDELYQATCVVYTKHMITLFFTAF